MGFFRKIYLMLVCGGIFALSSGAAFAAQPAWVNGETSEFPTQQYLLGRGVGSTETEAQNRARGDLVTTFEVRVQVAEENTTTVTKSGNQEQVNRVASQQVSAKTDKLISGIYIANLWRDPVTQDFHALAVLPRKQANASLREELAAIDESLQQQLKSAELAADALLKVGALTQALQLAIKREGFQAMLKVIDPSGKGSLAPVSQLSLQQQIGDTLQAMRISSTVLEDAGVAEFSRVMKGGLASAGFLSVAPANAEWLLESKLNLSDLGRHEGWYWWRASVEISLLENPSRRVRGSKTWPLKVSAQEAKTARTRVLLDVEKLLNEELRQSIIEFASH